MTYGTSPSERLAEVVLENIQLKARIKFLETENEHTFEALKICSNHNDELLDRITDILDKVSRGVMKP